MREWIWHRLLKPQIVALWSQAIKAYYFMRLRTWLSTKNVWTRIKCDIPLEQTLLGLIQNWDIYHNIDVVAASVITLHVTEDEKVVHSSIAWSWSFTFDVPYFFHALLMLIYLHGKSVFILLIRRSKKFNGKTVEWTLSGTAFAILFRR